MAAQDTARPAESIGLRCNRVELILLLIISAMLGLYWSTFEWLGSEWSSDNSIFEHGFLLAATAVVLILRSARRLQATDLKPCLMLLPVVIILSFGWLLGSIGDVIVVQTTILPFLALAAITTVLGIGVIRQLAFSILFIIFAMPVWELLQPILQSLTIAVATSLLEVTGRPVILEGDLVHLPGGVFRIASGCSGINFLVVGLALGALYGHFYYSSVSDRVKLLGAATIVALISNWVRVSSIIYIGDATNMQSSLVHDHQTFGWIIFSVALIPLYFIAGRIGTHKRADDPPQADAGRKNAAPKSAWLAFPVALLALAFGPAWAAMSSDKYSEHDKAILSLPETDGKWSGPDMLTIAWKPEFKGVSGETIGRYQSETGSVVLYNNVYLSQTQGEELIFVHNRVSGEFRKARSDTTSASLDGETFFDVRDIIVDDGRSMHRIWYWYEIDNSMQSSDVRAKIRQVFATLKGDPEAGLIAVAAICNSNCDAAGERIQSFLYTIGDEIRLKNRLEIGRINE